MKTSLSVAGCLVLVAGLATAQVNLVNSGCGGPTSVTSIGAGITLDQTGVNAAIGSIGALQRSTAASNVSYLPSGWAIDPTANGSINSGNAGFTIQFWYNPSSPTTFAYLAGDAGWVGLNGAFRIFQNGVAGTNNLIIRGPLTQLITLGAPLATPGYRHYALRYDQPANTLTWFVDGAVNASGPANITGTGSNFTIVGYNGSAAQGPDGFWDEIRLHDYAVSDADIAAFFNQTAGTCALPQISGTSGEIMVPQQGYYDAEIAQNDHTHTTFVNGETPDVRNRLFTNGTTIGFGGSSTAGNFVSTILLNVNAVALGGAGGTVDRTLTYLDAPPMPTVYTTPGIVALELGHGLSTPVAPVSLIWGDGLGLGAAIPGLATIVVPIPYDYNSPDLTISIPPGVFVPGDRIDVQDITIDPTWQPSGVGVSNRCTFICADTTPGPHFHAEARGVGVIQNTGFFELWNTGTVNITQVLFDLSTSTGGAGTDWAPAALLNSGGMLSTNDSYRYNSQLHCGLVGGTFTAANVNPTTGAPQALQFDFTDFTNVNHFVFDCAIAAGNVGGGSFAGTTVTVTYANGATLSGQLAADPADPNGVILDL